MSISDLLQNRNRWLLLNFASYLIFIFVFAVIYYCLFQSNPQNFAFNSDIATTKNDEIRTKVNQDVNNLTQELNSLRRLSEFLDNTAEPVRVEPDGYWDKVAFKTSDYQFRFELSPFWSYTDKQQIFKRNILNIQDNLGNQIAREDVIMIGPEDKTPNNRAKEIQDWIDSRATPIQVGIYKDMISPLINKISNDLDEKKNHFSLNKDNKQIIWSFWDFFYFSAITQATVGYGDILPNSTMVRLFVVLQVLIGLLMLGISINIVFGSKVNGR